MTGVRGTSRGVGDFPRLFMPSTRLAALFLGDNRSIEQVGWDADHAVRALFD